MLIAYQCHLTGLLALMQHKLKSVWLCQYGWPYVPFQVIITGPFWTTVLHHTEQTNQLTSSTTTSSLVANWQHAEQNRKNFVFVSPISDKEKKKSFATCPRPQMCLELLWITYILAVSRPWLCIGTTDWLCLLSCLLWCQNLVAKPSASQHVPVMEESLQMCCQ